ncbi:hypothetical protein Q4Q54_03765 [Shewanella sp. SP2S2-4]|uniref:hypothetical protein n=1 Tax=Shewanella sp. SP2S2-4 TaxID=3063539 RepID=UPI0028905F03|nr:hypothetical protein [Shewanella sp. SP2S2-4]MDT3272601.1 hypothetical protein [Shewanella sp. SP2S2-4]
MKNKTALIVLERPWGTNTSDNNRASVLPFFHGLQQLNGDFDVFHAQFYERKSFEMALNDMMELKYSQFYIYIACHGSGKRLEGLNLSTAMFAIHEKAQTNNIVGVVIGACEIGKNVSHLQAYSEGSSIVWQFGYKCSVNWLDGTLLDVKIFDELLRLKPKAFNESENIVQAFAEVLEDFKPEASIGYDRNGNPMPLKDSLTLVVQSKGQGKQAKDHSSELFNI